MLPAVFCTLLVVSCADDAPEYLLTTISFQGVVSDAEDGTPLEGISIDKEPRVLGESFFEFKVSDPEGSYLPVQRDLFMSSSSLYYSSSSKSYRVSDNDFALSR